MYFEWDATKAATNFRKHEVSFEEASSVFYDPLAATGADPDHSESEERFVTFGTSSAGRLLVISHVEHGEAIRIISARLATRPERSMRKAKSKRDELRAEYKRSDFRRLERGKYYDRVRASSNVVVLDPEVAAAFPNSEAVNRALHSLLEVAESAVSSAPGRQARPRRRSNGR